MKAWIVIALIGSTWASVVSNDKVITLLYDDPTLSDPVKMEVNINERADTITYHMPAEGNMADVETFEDYTTGFAASRDAEEEGCFIRKLSTNLTEETRDLEKTMLSGPQQYSGSLDLLAVPLDEESEIVLVGERIIKFCADYQMYKLVAGDEEENDLSKMEPEERFGFFSSRRCKCFSFGFCCYQFTCASVTGRTLIFFPFWPFFG